VRIMAHVPTPVIAYMHVALALLVPSPYIHRQPVFVSFFSSRRRHTSSKRDWSSDVCSSDLERGHAENFVPSGNKRDSGYSLLWRSEERRVGKERRSLRSPHQRISQRAQLEQRETRHKKEMNRTQIEYAHLSLGPIAACVRTC